MFERTTILILNLFVISFHQAKTSCFWRVWRWWYFLHPICIYSWDDQPSREQQQRKRTSKKSHGNSSMIEMFEQRFHPFSGWVFFHKAAYKKVQGMPTCLGCVASEILDVDICTKSAKAMSSHKQDRNLWICVVFLQLNCKAIRLFLLNRVCSTWFIKIP